MKPVYVRHMMLVKIAGHYNIKDKMFHIGGKEIPRTPSDVNHIIGLPCMVRC
jgi:hypothetical protein